MSIKLNNRPADDARALYLTSARMEAAPGHIPSLDGLRAISITVVLLSHFVSDQLFPGGLGVYVFFVISGFLITRLLFAERKKTGRVSLQRFYIRRIVRLYPVVIAFTIIVMSIAVFQHAIFPAIEPLSALFYFSNYLYATNYPASSFIIFWSLSVEEHFYLLLPAALILLRTPKRLLFAMVAVCVTCLAIRLIGAVSHPELLSTHYFYYRSECRLDSLAFGVMIAALCELDKGRVFIRRLTGLAPFLISLCAILACLLVRDPFFRETIRYTILGLAIATSICFVLFRRTFLSVILNWKPVVTVGLLSYSLYIWHYFLFSPAMLTWTQTLSASVRMTFLFSASFLLASVSYFGLERPLLRLRTRLQARMPGGGRLTEGSAVVP